MNDSALTPDGILLLGLLRAELAATPLDHWGFFFPAQVAVWRFIEQKRPGAFDELKAGYDSEPYFVGKGSEWFCHALGNREEYIALLEEIMYPLVPQVKPRSKERGFLYEEEVPSIEPDKIGRLVSVVVTEVDKAIKDGLIK